MTQRQLASLLKLLRREGVTRYTDGDLIVELGPIKRDAQDAQRKQYPSGPDVSIPEDTNPQVVNTPSEWGEITDLRASLEARYRTEGTEGKQ